MSIVQGKIYRDFAGLKYTTSIGVIRNIIFNITELVEERIIAELKITTCWAIMNDD